jgi:hypothetical protein
VGYAAATLSGENSLTGRHFITVYGIGSDSVLPSEQDVAFFLDGE